MDISPFVAEIGLAPFNFAPTGWAFCDGQLMMISQNTALFSLLGTTYGGDGRSTFALPNLQGSVPIHQGQGPGLSQYFLGQTGGESAHTLLQSEIPVHTHSVSASGSAATSGSAVGNYYGSPAAGTQPAYYAAATDGTTMSPSMVGATGGSLAFSVLKPYLVLNYVIALQGVYPSRQ